MIEPLSAIASVVGLADVSCRLAGTLYNSFRALKEAPPSIQRLSSGLQKFHRLLQEVDKHVKRYERSPFVLEDGLSVDTLQNYYKTAKQSSKSSSKLPLGFKARQTGADF